MPENEQEIYEEFIRSMRAKPLPKMNIDQFLEKYKLTWISYCEVILTPDGLITLAQPSHTQRLEYMTGLDQRVLYDMIPITASPVHWMLQMLGCVSVWHDFQLAPQTAVTDQQLETIKQLGEAKMINVNIQYF